MDSSKLIKAVNKVTGKWAKQRKAEERNARAASNRRHIFRFHQYSIKDAAREIMETAYMKASANNTLPAHARQIMYAARGYIQNKTDKPLNDKYFTQTLLPDYINEHPVDTADWDVVFDARGNLLEPHTGENLPLGTLQVRRYLSNATSSFSTDYKLNYSPPVLCDTKGPHHRYQAILFIEKESFMPLFKKVELAERYDIAIMSTKGLSTTAARTLVEALCSSIPLYVLHDFDKSGFSIVGTLQRDTRRYTFDSRPNVIDLGLRLADVEANDLEPEDVSNGGSDPAWNLRQNGATREEIDFLQDQRVELNAFPSDLLVKWIEEKLAQEGIQKLVPEDAVLEKAYRRAVAIKYVKEKLGALNEEAEKIGKDATMPPDLRARVIEELKDRVMPWDEALYKVCVEGS